MRYTKEYLSSQFLEKALKKHNGIYDYSLVDYNGSYEKVKIICEQHGIFEQAPFKHLSGNLKETSGRY